MKISVETTYNPSMRELAEEFCSRTDQEMVEFFDWVHSISTEWNTSAVFQWHNVSRLAAGVDLYPRDETKAKPHNNAMYVLRCLADCLEERDIQD